MPTHGNVETLIGRLRFRHLRVLTALNESGSMHRAAELVRMTQPGITKALQEIESVIGAELFERSATGVTATPIGHCVIRYAYIMYAELAKMSTEIEAIDGGHGGSVALGAVAGAFPAMVARAVTQMRRSHPALGIKVTEGTSAMLLASLSAGSLDFAICRTTVAANPDIFDHEAFGEEPIAFVAAPDSFFAGRRHLSQIISCRWVLFPSHMPIRRLLERELMEYGLEMPHCPIEASSTFATVLMLNEDPGLIGMVSRRIAEFFAGKGLLTILPIEIKCRTEPFELVTRKGYILTSQAQALVDELRNNKH